MNCTHCKRRVEGSAHITTEMVFHQECIAPYRRHQMGLDYECPKCTTTGKMEDPQGRTHEETVPLDYGETPSCAYNDCRGCSYCHNKTKSITVTNKVVCNLCHGQGWLTKEPVPVTKIVDWKLP